MFAVSESKRLPPEKINLLICYVLVLTLFSDEFRTDYTDIAKDLSMNILPVRQLYEHLGCKISRQKNIMYATLPVPLKFPELRLRKRKRQMDHYLSPFFGSNSWCSDFKKLLSNTSSDRMFVIILYLRTFELCLLFQYFKKRFLNQHTQIILIEDYLVLYCCLEDSLVKKECKFI